MKQFTAIILGADIGVLTALSIFFLTNNIPSWRFGFWIMFIGILNVVAFLLELNWKKG